jgi:hypothetical protein
MNKPQVLVKISNLSKEDEQLIKRMMAVAGITDYDIVNLRYYRCPMYINKETVKLYIAFGQEAAAAPLIFSHGYDVIQLPDLKDVRDEPENDSTRQTAYDKLKQLSEYLKFVTLENQQRILRWVDLPKFGEEELLQLEKTLKARGITGITGLNHAGKTVRIKLDEQDVETADLVINFEELLAIRLAVNLLDLKEVQIVTSHREDNSNNTSSSPQ